MRRFGRRGASRRRNRLIIHVLEHDQRIVRPAQVTERRIVGTIEQYLAIAVVQVTHCAGSAADACVEIVDRQNLPAGACDQRELAMCSFRGAFG